MNQSSVPRMAHLQLDKNLNQIKKKSPSCLCADGHGHTFCHAKHLPHLVINDSLFNSTKIRIAFVETLPHLFEQSRGNYIWHHWVSTPRTFKSYWIVSIWQMASWRKMNLYTEWLKVASRSERLTEFNHMIEDQLKFLTMLSFNSNETEQPVN